MVFDIHEVDGIGGYDVVEQGGDTIYSVTGGGRAFLVVHDKTIEFRTDEQLKKLLIEKYESVMVSRYFGRAGVEIVMSGQLTPKEVQDLVRLSYILTVKMG